MSPFIKRSSFVIAGMILLLCFILLPWSEFIYKPKSKAAINDSIKTRLITLAGRSLASEDVPVGAVLIYKDTIIGTGYNTVRKDSVAYGHAEINALNGALKKYGLTNFLKLDRNKLELITTLEPCEMCKGAIVEYRIKHVKFMKAKDLSYWFKENRWKLLYQFKKVQIEGEAQQDSLFHLHPHYGK